MISKIVLEESANQKRYLKIAENKCRPENEIQGKIVTHKRSLANLKEYFEEQIENLKPSKSGLPCLRYDIIVDQFKEDIQELTKMIEAYE